MPSKLFDDIRESVPGLYDLEVGYDLPFDKWQVVTIDAAFEPCEHEIIVIYIYDNEVHVMTSCPLVFQPVINRLQERVQCTSG